MLKLYFIFFIFILFGNCMAARIPFLELSINPINEIEVRKLKSNNLIIYNMQTGLLFNNLKYSINLSMGSTLYYDTLFSFYGGAGVATWSYLTSKASIYEATMMFSYLKNINKVKFELGPEVGLLDNLETMETDIKSSSDESGLWDVIIQKNPDDEITKNQTVNTLGIILKMNINCWIKLNRLAYLDMGTGYRYCKMKINRYPENNYNKFETNSQFGLNTILLKIGLILFFQINIK